MNIKLLIRTLSAALLIAVLFASCLSTLESLAGSLGTGTARPAITNAEAVSALRDALKVGATSASEQLSVTDGYFGSEVLRILLPPEARPLIDNVGKIPQGQKLIDDVVLRLNRSAEEAAKDVVPIFTDAIMSMTIADGIAIIKGGDHAATDYFKSKTRPALYNLYRPKVDAALARPLVMNISAKRSWENLTTAYNRVGTLANSAAALAGRPAPMPAVQTDLAGWATNRALDGLFFKVAEEELKIRRNPLGYASDMIRKVFGALKDGFL